ncbi:hypothetical protein [Kribbella speibonae]|uniref:Uncharacterized protein n=1 Tax=Kribbella speibonae TaxID=1572660 RepID=A0A4R0IR52_9ACTN|nr:hypothetical protein [Kribbella speibonae]TCC36263.1 hypothetical protein E0H92_26765 [Kribbella speibonae]
MTRDPSNEVKAVTTDPSVVADDANYELGVAMASEPDDALDVESEEQSFDPTATTALESDLQNLKSAAEVLEGD